MIPFMNCLKIKLNIRHNGVDEFISARNKGSLTLLSSKRNNKDESVEYLGPSSPTPGADVIFSVTE